MKKQIFILATLVVALVSCSKEAALTTGSEDNAGAVKYNYSLYGSQVLPDEAEDTKITINNFNAGASGTSLKWETGDAIQLVKVSDGVQVGTATVGQIGTEEKEYKDLNIGKFDIESTATPGTAVRVLYPSTATFGSGTISSDQGKDTTTPARYPNCSNTTAVMSLNHMYSDEITLAQGEPVKFNLKPALAVVRLDFVLDDEYFTDWETSDGWLGHVVVRTVDSPLSGDYTVDYETGAVTPGTNTKDYVDLNAQTSIGNSYKFSRYITCLPTNGEKVISVTVNFSGASKGKHVGEKYTIPVRFKGDLKAGRVNEIDLGKLAFTEEYMTPYKNDYYARYLLGETIQIGDLAVNKTNFPTATLVRADELTSTVFNAGGLFFIDDCGTAVHNASLSAEMPAIATSKELVVIGRWKDIGKQPMIQKTEMRINKYDVSLLNVGINCMRQGNESAGNVFAKQSTSTNEPALRLKDCYIDAKNCRFIIDLNCSKTDGKETFRQVYFENCTIDMPRVQNGSGKTASVKANANCAFFAVTVEGPASTVTDVTVKDCNIFTSSNVKYRTSAEQEWPEYGKVYMIYTSNSSTTYRKMTNVNFDFESNTLANFQNNYGIFWITANTINSLKFNKNLVYVGGGAADFNNNVVFRAGSNYNAVFTNTPEIDYNFVCTSSATRSGRLAHDNADYAMPEGSYGTNNMDTATAAASTKSMNPFSVEDYTTGFLVVDPAKVTNGAGALAAKGYISPSLGPVL